MESWYVHIIHFRHDSADEIFLGPCTQEVVKEWLPRNRFKINEESQTEIRGSRWITEGKTGLIAIFRTFSIEELDGRTIRELPRWF